jgi:hypothetical protein
MSEDVLGAFDEVYITPQRCGYGTQCLSMNKYMKYSINEGITFIDG